jgi:general secretion pathway protein M
MSAASRSLTAVSTSPLVATASYLGLFVLLLFVVISSLSDLIGLRSDVAASAGMLEQLEGRSRAKTAPGEAAMPPISKGRRSRLPAPPCCNGCRVR